MRHSRRVRGLSLLRTVMVFALGVCIGALLLGHGILLPMVRNAALVDPNLARAIASPLVLRTAELLLAGAVAATMVCSRVVAEPTLARVASTSALVLTAVAAVERVIVLPRLEHSIALVDLVSGRPTEVMEVVTGLERVHNGLLGAAALALVVSCVCATWSPKLTLAAE